MDEAPEIMEQVPYAICRIDTSHGIVAAYMLISPYHVESRRLNSDEVHTLTLEPAVGRRVWSELEALARDDTPRDLRLDNSQETFLLAQEFSRDAARLLSVDAITLAAPAFAAERMGALLRSWTDAESAGVPICPLKCRSCGNHLECDQDVGLHPPGAGLLYRCIEHPQQHANYNPAARDWSDRRE